MPARQDQTLQIFLIIFIFAFLVTAVVAYLGWRGYSEADARAIALKTSLDEKSTQAQNKDTELEDMRQLMGFGRNDNAPDIKKAGEDDMKTFGAGIAEGSYRKVLQTVYAEDQAALGREAKQKEEIKKLNERLTAIQTQDQAQINQYDAQRKKAQEDLRARAGCVFRFPQIAGKMAVGSAKELGRSARQV